MRAVRLAVLGATAMLWAGCYSPKLTNLGFACDSTAAKPCPDGYTCRNGFCDDGSGGTPPGPAPGTGGNGSDDMSMPDDNGGGGGGTGGGSQDMAMSLPPDMARQPVDMARAPADLAKPPRDLAQQCGHDLDPCTQDSDCCSNDCFFDGTCFGG